MKTKTKTNEQSIIFLDPREKEIELIAEEGSTVEAVMIQGEKEDMNLENEIKCYPGKDATINLNFFIFGSKTHKINIENYLKEEGGNINNSGIFIGSGEQEFDIYTRAYHTAPHTYCNMLVKGALKDSSKSNYEGLVDISKEGENCRGFQREETLILSEKAKAHALPLLNVNNNNVEVKHGATIGRIDKELLFYMKSRGLTEQEAKIKMVEGFFNPLMKNLKQETRNTILTNIRKKMVE